MSAQTDKMPHPYIVTGKRERGVGTEAQKLHVLYSATRQAMFSVSRKACKNKAKNCVWYQFSLHGIGKSLQ